MIRITLNPAPQNQATEVVIKPGLLANLSSLLPDSCRSSPLVIVTDSHVGPLYADLLEKSLLTSGLSTKRFIIEAGEASKTLQTASRIYDFLAHSGFPRNGLIVALGGGVGGDLAGFVAGTWMRGVRWVYCPTTLEADVDACLGGKTAVNLAAGKNLVGVLHNPTLVSVDPNCLSTLPQRDIRAGLAEAVKHALLQSPQEVEWLEANAAKILALDSETVTGLIERNLRFKGQIVGEDPHEHLDRRIILNFGHSIGHAIEANAEGELRHGECVSLGMLAACRISHRAGLLDDDTINRIRNLLILFHLPTKLELPLDRKRVLKSLLLDKKNARNKTRLVLLSGIGSPVIREDIPPAWIAEAFDSL